MQIPERLLAEKMRASAKVALMVMWQSAEGEPAWTGLRVTDIIKRGGLNESTAFEVVAMLLERGAIRRETRRIAGRDIKGFGLSRALLPAERSPGKPGGGTRENRSHGPGQRDITHSPEAGQVIAQRGRRGGVAVIEKIDEFEAHILTPDGARRKVAIYQDGRYPRVGGYRLTGDTLKTGKNMLEDLKSYVQNGGAGARRSP